MIETQVGGTVGLVTIGGDVDLATAPLLRRGIGQAVSQGAKRVVVDLSEVSFLDSTGLGVLVGSLERVKANEGELVLVGPQPPVRRILSVTGVDRVVTICARLEEAVTTGEGRLEDVP